jgi:hypothetical protein
MLKHHLTLVYVYTNPNLPYEVLRRVAPDPEKLARNHSTPADVLWELARTGDASIRYCVADNQNAPVGILEYLCVDVRGDVRCAVACNPHTPGHVLDKLSTDKIPTVRAIVAEHTNTSRSTLEALAQDPNLCTRRTAQRRLAQ